MSIVATNWRPVVEINGKAEREVVQRAALDAVDRLLGRVRDRDRAHALVDLEQSRGSR